MVIFYEMGDGSFIAEAHRGTNLKVIRKLQEQEWARKRGGICRIRKLTDERAIYYAMNPRPIPLIP